ncbi:hypothetical protein EJ04DRAFT_497096 [Polyplosphaeria fusca]|uniref:F-box domain-containing protein n=1 Tax=Polyplosphaeria fusca TaxID=682080 RepID=A0A9P4V0L4_9PLEO|nr:hypothetical protein EJ04DRAFT_497096 [Polyplosphaeria fusca]
MDILRHLRDGAKLSARDRQPTKVLSLLSFVDELLLSIISHIDSHSSLCNLASTCSRMQGLVEPFIWPNLLIRSGHHAVYVNDALTKRPERLSMVRDLSIRYHYTVEEGIEILDRVLPYMEKLRFLHIESPCPNNDPWRNDIDTFESSTRVDYKSLFTPLLNFKVPSHNLPALQSFTLHGHGPTDTAFDFGDLVAVFFHPTLRSINLSCTNFNTNVAASDIPPEKLKSTALQYLTFIECNVYVSLLDYVLRLPKALKELSIGERLYVFQSCIPTDEPRTSDPLFLDALQHQADSLTVLKHIGGTSAFLRPRITNSEGAAKLRNLKTLRHLDLGLESSLIQYLRIGGCPSSLQTLRLSDEALASSGYHQQELFTVVMRDIYTLVIEKMSSAINVDICFAHTPEHRGLHNAWGGPEAGQQNRNVVYKLARALKSRTCKLRVFGQRFPRDYAFIPPYMYGEDMPTEELQYDSDRPWTFKGVSWQAADDDEGRYCTACADEGQDCVLGSIDQPCQRCLQRGRVCSYAARL